MKLGTQNLMKFRKLQARLGVSRWAVTGLLQELWLLAELNAPRGDIGRFSDEEIGLGLYWEGPAAALVEALVETGWLDRDPVHRLVVHDWSQHCETRVHSVLARRGVCFVDGTAPRLSGLSGDERARVKAMWAGRKEEGGRVKDEEEGKAGDLRSGNVRGQETLAQQGGTKGEEEQPGPKDQRTKGTERTKGEEEQPGRATKGTKSTEYEGVLQDIAAGFAVMEAAPQDAPGVAPGVLPGAIPPAMQTLPIPKPKPKPPNPKDLGFDPEVRDRGGTCSAFSASAEPSAAQRAAPPMRQDAASTLGTLTPPLSRGEGEPDRANGRTFTPTLSRAEREQARGGPVMAVGALLRDSGRSPHPSPGGRGSMRCAASTSPDVAALNGLWRRGVVVARDGPEWRGWWKSAYQALAVAEGGLAEWERVVRYAEDCADPAVRRAKDLGVLKRPGAWMVGELMRWARAHKVRLPTLPSGRER